ncbi:substrate-binding domain-containing protein [Nonomuraea sp. NPDC050451]|uniref:substrate-binding domain-containing protein n=1 Tax=Nonomuraea sp. NPDC050451 TaxID=3364364 RepID=UPI00379F9D9E
MAGFDDIGSAVDVAPTLTSVAVPLVEVGAEAMRLALADGHQESVITIPTAVRLRESTPRAMRAE